LYANKDFILILKSNISLIFNDVLTQKDLSYHELQQKIDLPVIIAINKELFVFNCKNLKLRAMLPIMIALGIFFVAVGVSFIHSSRGNGAIN
jgi:hypothetical protein